MDTDVWPSSGAQGFSPLVLMSPLDKCNSEESGLVNWQLLYPGGGIQHRITPPSWELTGVTTVCLVWR